MADPVPVRALGQYGIVRDAAPFDLPPNAWSHGCNVVFQAGRVTSAPVSRNLTDLASLDLAEPPVHVCVQDTATGYDPIVAATRDFRMRLFVSNTATDISPTGIAAAASDEKYTSSILGSRLYLNRSDQVPLVFDTTTNRFVALPNWDASWRAKSVRAYKDFLFALNVTKGAVQYPSMVKWSNATAFGEVPNSWDPAALQSLAAENVLAEATSPIVDGLPLGNSFVIMTSHEVFSADFIGAPNVFEFRRLFSDDGVIARNAAVEVAGRLYVFGSRDCYVTDGATKKSLMDGRVKSHVYNSLDGSKAAACFVFHYPKLNSVMFAYPSLDNTAKFRGGQHANRAAVYCYANDTWSFMDLPNVSSSTYANVASKTLWSTTQPAWDAIGGQWSDQDVDLLKHVVMTSVKSSAAGVSASRLVALDDVGSSTVNKPTVPELLAPAYVERRGLTLESLGIHLDSRSATSSLYPLIQSQNPDQGVTITFGRSDVPDAEPLPFNAVRFDPKRMHKVDSRNTGRFLSLRVDFPTVEAVYLSGYDVEVIRISRR